MIVKLQGLARHGVAWQGQVWYGMVRRGVVWCGMARQGLNFKDLNLAKTGEKAKKVDVIPSAWSQLRRRCKS